MTSDNMSGATYVRKTTLTIRISKRHGQVEGGCDLQLRLELIRISCDVSQLTPLAV